ncbi:MAG: hypothetical protein KC468_16950, partial [Myxococcales bacterium]|nr:hypothetical protein [Myxococcales bacterium]
NRWLASELTRVDGGDYEVTGVPEPLLECPCCGYLTLGARGAYEICPVCFWEDDGSDDLDRHSGPNHMALREGRRNFERFGACSEGATLHVRPDGRSMYHHAHPPRSGME